VYRCVTNVGIQDDVSIGKAKIVATLTQGQLVEALAEPEEEPSAKVMRLKLKTLEGDKTGFGTIKGNQGTVYLEPLSADELRALDTSPAPMETDAPAEAAPAGEAPAEEAPAPMEED